MANINFDVEEFICESPILTSVVYTGIRYIFEFSYTSQGDYYYTFDPTTEIQIWYQTDGQSTWYQVSPPLNALPFNANGYEIDLLNYVPEPKGVTIFKIILINNAGCNNESNTIDVTVN